MSGKLYLIPTPIAREDEPFMFQPDYNREVMVGLSYYVVEELRTARRHISRCKLGRPIEELNFEELNEHTQPQDVERMLKPLVEGHNVGIMSEAGVPGVADPGAELVALAHKKDIEVIPLVGPSSILLALMGSGMCGQSFCFNGYLPVKSDERNKALKELEARARKGQTQIFIEAPYRNGKLMEDLVKILSPETNLCVACNITAENQLIKTRTISQWRRVPAPAINKIPCIFLVG